MVQTTETESRKLLGRLRDALAEDSAGQERLDKITHLIATSMGTEVCSIYLFRDEETLEPTVYVKKLPKDLNAGPVILVDPMLATGGSASEAATLLRQDGVSDLRMMCLVASPEGVKRMAKDHPDITVYAAAVDRQLDERGYICPGLGDAGDRMYGTV